MYTLKTSAAFDSAHFLAGYSGKCANIHGHRWVIVVEAGLDHLQQEGEKRGMVIDFSELKSTVRTLADEYDHALIYEQDTLKNTTIAALRSEGFKLIAVPYRPTAENFAKAFYDELELAGLPVTSVTVYETPENSARYEA